MKKPVPVPARRPLSLDRHIPPLSLTVPFLPTRIFSTHSWLGHPPRRPRSPDRPFSRPMWIRMLPATTSSFTGNSAASLTALCLLRPERFVPYRLFFFFFFFRNVTPDNGQTPRTSLPIPLSSSIPYEPPGKRVEFPCAPIPFHDWKLVSFRSQSGTVFCFEDIRALFPPFRGHISVALPSVNTSHLTLRIRSKICSSHPPPP